MDWEHWRGVALTGLAVLGVAALIALGLFIGIARYDECRAHGFSVFYCLTSR
jgi:hypothetical protein